MIEHRDGLIDEHCGGEPCVLRGAARAWPALSWTLEHLRTSWPGLRVPVAALDQGRLAIGPRGLELREISLGDWADGYLMAPLAALPPSLRGDLVEPRRYRRAAWRSAKLWGSPAGAVTPLHFDLSHNLHVQLVGSKRFTLFSPRDPLYRCSITSPTPNFSRVDPEAPDLERYPRFRAARPAQCTLEPGDIVYLPSRYWHHVRTERDSLSVNFWWADGALALAARAADGWKRAFALSR